MTLVPISSSVRAVGCDGHTLGVEFHSGRWRTCDHPGVLESVFHELMNALSMGAYYNRRIRWKYRWGDGR